LSEKSDQVEAGARAMSKRSMAAIRAKDREAWLELFAEDAIVEDPIGPSMLDAEGKGQRGKEEIGAFFDNIISPNELIEFDIVSSYQCGEEVANVGTIHITFPGAKQIASVPLVSTYKIGPDGRLVALRAYWEAEQMTIRDV
jgi:steroid delta-isomerase